MTFRFCGGSFAVASELFSISMHQYRLTLQAQAEICQDSEVRAQWQSMVDLANRAYDLLKREPDDLVEHEKFFSQAIALLEQSTAWPEWAPVLSSAARKARIDRVLAEFMDRIYS
ncbi:uncharacterized protein ARMOST_16233 [Armillaria ostoyae]|uniref:Uncharacterized protein n=2 Tax=Armillaria TaxID=47424 RepID=A0A284RVL3_ARMOS|nr:hypothetical protein ARMSODRAFT_1017783 [Armillaria solidipes]SJL12802.1 uncharacterized protein ARMOST_16233 [Armillaria ostoyae]